MALIITIPRYINNDLEGFTFLAEIAATSMLWVGQDVQLDFENCEFFAGNLCAVLGGILEGLMGRRNKIIITNLPLNIKGFLSSNKFLTYFVGLEIPDFNHTTIPFSSFKINDETSVKNYVEEQLLNKPEMPVVSDKLKKEMVKSIFEIYVNAITHGNCDTVFSCGQHYRRKEPPEIYFTFVDLGKTIKNNVAEFLNRQISGIESIVWATSDNNSTKKENHSGGLGLKLIKEFIELNNGILQIVSANGVWELNRGTILTNQISIDFPGTFVTLVFNLKDKQQYFMKDEINLDNIF